MLTLTYCAIFVIKVVMSTPHAFVSNVQYKARHSRNLNKSRRFLTMFNLVYAPTIYN